MLKVSSDSNPSAAAGAIANGIRQEGFSQLQVIGPRAVNQAIKAIAIARGYLAASGADLYFEPEFSSVQISDQERTAIQMTVRMRHPVNFAPEEEMPIP